MQCYIDDKEFGRVIVTLRRGMRNVVCRWKDTQLHISAPYGVGERLLEMLERDREKIRSLKHGEITFHEGQVIPCFRTTLTITTDARLAGQAAFGIDPADGKSLYLRVPAGTDFSSERVGRAISNVISTLLGRIVGRYLIPYAEAEAARLGLQPLRFEIGRGKNKLGHCTQKGVIQLSRFLMLMPEPLVQCVVCHELAHLTHMDHSPAFHALLDSYLDGHRAELDRQVNRFAWPIYR